MTNYQNTYFQMDDISAAVNRAFESLRSQQHDDGHWCFEFEADCTIPAEYVLMMHFMGEIDQELQEQMACYLRRRQLPEGGWPLYLGGTADISCTIKAYYALKLVGDAPHEAHMLRARRVVLEKGGAAKANVFTRIMLATFEQLPWRGVPYIPVEIMLLPRWFFFHLSKVSYWSRTVMVPLFVIYTLKAKAKNPSGCGVPELFITPPNQEKHYFPIDTPMRALFRALDIMGRTIDPLIPVGLREHAIKKACTWFRLRLNGEHGLGAIFPAMVNALEALKITGHSADDPEREQAKKALESLVVRREEESYCQPCVSPVWDTALSAVALQQAGNHSEANECATKALEWLKSRQLFDAPGDWREYRPELPGGGWAFQYRNDYYPDLDDTAVVAYALRKCSPNQAYSEAYENAYLRAARWLVGMQSKNGGFAAFDADNTAHYLNHIPFADHGALLDPPTADVSARCLMLLGTLVEDYPEFLKSRDHVLTYLSNQQEQDGSWFGRWGTNYVYGTWSALIALEANGIHGEDPRSRRAAAWLKSCQNRDGGWGEDNDSYAFDRFRGTGYRSTTFQTAWALIGLMAAGETHSNAVTQGIRYLLNNQQADGLWNDPEFTSPGFPRVFYLKYHGYDKFFPLWALARYQQETETSDSIKN